jgi:hypothetical protein
MTPEQQRLHEQHKARLARIQNSAYRPPEALRPASTLQRARRRIPLGGKRRRRRGT